VLKTSAAEELVIAIREVLQGKTYVSPLVTKDPASFFVEARLARVGEEKLTARQREVVQLLAEGRSMKEVAYVLKLTTRTVAFHKYKIMELLRIKSNAELVQYAMREHIVSERL